MHKNRLLGQTPNIFEQIYTYLQLSLTHMTQL